MEDEYLLVSDESVQYVVKAIRTARKVVVLATISILTIFGVRHYRRVSKELGL